jgi:hypothetical protein
MLPHVGLSLGASSIGVLYTPRVQCPLRQADSHPGLSQQSSTQQSIRTLTETRHTGGLHTGLLQ